ncbi:hypothetical protein E0Z10_g4353 [Xylaria hypoxylon]|uniref:Uncharacterized protein n=1 Tax=Xylaria hypoxylon TaxID=37992 RepID=A0A4Z0YLA1_9PEZI|nr:hypothetical protein E0Z10_g4353 [Xylaria hypoxylon]
MFSLGMPPKTVDENHIINKRFVIQGLTVGKSSREVPTAISKRNNLASGKKKSVGLDVPERRHPFQIRVIVAKIRLAFQPTLT